MHWHFFFGGAKSEIMSTRLKGKLGGFSSKVCRYINQLKLGGFYLVEGPNWVLPKFMDQIDSDPKM